MVLVPGDRYSHAIWTINRWVLGSSTRGTGTLMPSELITKGFWVGVPWYEGFYVVRTVSRCIFGSGAKGTGALMPSELVTRGFWVRVTKYEGFHTVRTVNR